MWVWSAAVRAAALVGVAGLSLPACERHERAREGEGEGTGSAAGAEVVRLDPAQAKAAGLEVAPAARRPIAETRPVPGIVQARPADDAVVLAPFDGRIVSGAPRVIGARVARGDLLAVLEPTVTVPDVAAIGASAGQVGADLAAARAEEGRARADVARLEPLVRDGVVPARRLDDARAALETARGRAVALGRAAAQVGAAPGGRTRTTLRAPRAGELLVVTAQPGSSVRAGDTLFRVAERDTLWVRAELPVGLPTQVPPGTMVTVIPEGGGASGIPARLVTVGALVDATTRTLPVVLELPDPAHRLPIGSVAEVRWPVGPRHEAVVVPTSALRLQEAGAEVWVETAPGVYAPRAVTVGAREPDGVELKTGVNLGDRVVVRGAQILRAAGEIGAPAEEP